MTKRLIQCVSPALLSCAFLCACSRPVAYFQRGTNELHLLAAKPNELPPIVEPQTEISTKEIVTNEIHKPQEVYASVTKEGTMQLNKKHWDYAKQTRTAESKSQTLAVTTSSHRMSGLNRLLIKKLNKRIARQLAPQHAKAVSNTGYLIGGTILLIGGLKRQLSERGILKRTSPA